MTIDPCPFCGGNAHLDVDPGSYGYRERMVGVKCSQCGASIPQVPCETFTQGIGYAQHNELSEREVIERWNWRAAVANQPSAVLTERERCARIVDGDWKLGVTMPGGEQEYMLRTKIAAKIRSGE